VVRQAVWLAASVSYGRRLRVTKTGNAGLWAGPPSRPPKALPGVPVHQGSLPTGADQVSDCARYRVRVLWLLSSLVSPHSTYGTVKANTNWVVCMTGFAPMPSAQLTTTVDLDVAGDVQDMCDRRDIETAQFVREAVKQKVQRELTE